MQIKGTQRIAAPPEKVWEALNDPEVLAKCTPGAKEMTLEGEDRYRAVLQVGVGPVRSKFSSTIQVKNKKPPESLTLEVEAQSPTGTVRASGDVELANEGDVTLVSYSGEAKLMGPLAGLGGRVLQGVAKQQAGKFFKALEQEVTGQAP